MPRVRCHQCGSSEMWKVVSDRPGLGFDWQCWDCKARRPYLSNDRKDSVLEEGVMMTPQQAEAVRHIRRALPVRHSLGRADAQYEYRVFTVEKMSSGRTLQVLAELHRAGDDHDWVYGHQIFVGPGGSLTAYRHESSKRGKHKSQSVAVHRDSALSEYNYHRHYGE